MARPNRAQPPRRRDAEHNRARVLAAARELFASAGFDVPLAEIAERAGVGRATLYRNFPDRSALAAAIIDENLVALEALAAAHGGEPGAFMLLLRGMVEQAIEIHALFPALMTVAGQPEGAELVRRTKRLLREPLRIARAEGLVRPDLTLADVLSGLAMISAVVGGDLGASARRQRGLRALDLLLYGMAPRSLERRSA